LQHGGSVGWFNEDLKLLWSKEGGQIWMILLPPRVAELSQCLEVYG